MNNCPCDIQSKEECDICRDTDTIEKGVQRKMNTSTTLPREKSKRVQDILKDESLSLDEQANDIYRYDLYMIKKNRKGGIPAKPLYSKAEIKDIIIDRYR